MKKPIIFCIGTPKIVGDSFGPVFGSIMKNLNKSLIIYGTIEKPITALNLEDYLVEIKNKYPQKKILSIDCSCVKRDKNLNLFILSNSPISAGNAVGRELTPVGDYSIKVTLAKYNKDNNSLIMALNKINHNELISISKKLVGIFLELI